MSYSPPRVLFVLKYRKSPYTYNSAADESNPDLSKSISSGLSNSARFLSDMLNTVGVESKVVHVVDNSTIYKEAMAFKADVVVIEALWVVPDKFDELFRVNPKIKYIVRNHSETPFLANEGIAFDWIMQYATKPNVVIGSNSKRMHDETRFLVELAHPGMGKHWLESKVLHLPNYYPLESGNPHRLVSSKEYVDVGCFGDIRPLKNQVAQAIAALKFATNIKKPLRFHVNVGHIDQSGEQIIKNLKRLFYHFPEHKLIQHPWLSHEEFKRLVASMDLMSQVSFSETFNIVAADAVSQGVPTITSPEISWASWCFRCDPTSSDDMTHALEKAYHVKSKIPSFNPSLNGLRKHDVLATREWVSSIAMLTASK